jgi:hypothetical protein
MISMWSRPRNPQRNPKPRAVELSGSKKNEAGEDHGLDVFKAGHGLDGGMVGIGNGIADLDVADRLHGGEEESDLAGGELTDLLGLGRQHAHGID